MEAFYLFLLLTIPLIIGIVGVFAIGEIHETVQDWDTRRCDFDYMMSAFRYKPVDDPRSIGEFAADNLKSNESIVQSAVQQDGNAL